MVTTLADRSIDRLTDLAQSAPASTVDAVIRVLETAARNKEKAGAMTRMLLAVTDLTEELAIDSLIDASGAQSNLAVLLQTLEQPEVIDEVREQDPLAPARLRGLRARRQILSAEGGTYSTQETADLLGLSRQAVDNRRKKGKLLGITLGRHGYRYPAWQFTQDGVIPGLGAVLNALDGYSPWMHSAFLLNKNARLDGKRPLDELRRGNVEGVLKAARMYGEQTAV